MVSIVESKIVLINGFDIMLYDLVIQEILINYYFLIVGNGLGGLILQYLIDMVILNIKIIKVCLEIEVIKCFYLLNIKSDIDQ